MFIAVDCLFIPFSHLSFWILLCKLYVTDKNLLSMSTTFVKKLFLQNYCVLFNFVYGTFPL